MRGQMAVVVTLAMAAAALFVFALWHLGDWCVDSWYLSESAVQARNDKAAEGLRAFAASQEIPASGSAAMEQWAAAACGDGSVIVFLPGDYVYESAWWGSQPITRTDDLAQSLRGEGYSFYSIDFADGEYTVAIFSSAATRLYDLCSFLSIALGAAALVSILLAYAGWVTRRISTLSSEVNAVSHGDLNHEIVPLHRDEISRLARDVETMRTTIIQRVQSEQNALQANSELITALSHDIRNPLTALIGYLELLEMDLDALPEADQSYVRACLDKSYRIRDLTGEMFRYFLVFSKEAQSVELESYDAQMVLWQLLGEYAEDLLAQGFQVETHALQTPCTLRTDVNLLKRVVDNLVSNVEKYADAASPVILQAEAADGALTIRIQNRVAPPRPDAVESNRVGLRTCGTILQLLGGSFSVRTEDGCFTAECVLPVDPGAPETEEKK